MTSITGKKTFGAGRFFGINNVSNPTPMRAILPQDMSVDFKRATKDLYGNDQFAAAVAAGEMSVTGKVSMGTTNARMFSDLLFSDSGSTGRIVEVDKEAGTVPASTAYIVTTANHTTWTTDLGVTDATGKVFTRVSSVLAAGQYSVAAGVYTFYSTDANTNVLISYLYTDSTTGETLTMTNPVQGPGSSFTAVMAFIYGAEQDVLTLNNCIATDGGLSTKGGDFMKPSLGFAAATDTNNVLGTFSFAQAA